MKFSKDTIKNKILASIAIIRTTTVTGAFGLICLASAQPGLCAPTVYTVDTTKSSVTWTGEKVTGSHNGTLQIKSGSAQVEDGKLVGGTFEFAMDTIKDVDIDDPKYNKKLTDHLFSDDFFSVAKFPTSTFTITKAEPILTAAATEPNYTVTGNLSVKGISLPITFPAKVQISGETASASAQTKVDRTKYNIKYGSGKFFEGLGDKLIYDEFTVAFDLAAMSN